MHRIEEIKSYYHNCVRTNKTSNFDDLLKQVGKTFLGETINQEVFDKIICSIQESLQISKYDEIIDLGCANGLITSKISKYCKNIFAYDLSDDLIKVAKQYNKKENILYFHRNILDINFTLLKFNKIYMYEVLQHIEYGQFRHLLHELFQNVSEFKFLIGSIPDAEKLFEFYNTKERKKYYFNEVLEKNKFHIGTWWYKEHILMICEELGLKATIIDQDEKLHTAHYRFDVLIEKVIR